MSNIGTTTLFWVEVVHPCHNFY